MRTFVARPHTKPSNALGAAMCTRRRLADEVLALQAQGLPNSDHLLPPAAQPAKKQQDGKAKK